MIKVSQNDDCHWMTNCQCLY